MPYEEYLRAAVLGPCGLDAVRIEGTPAAGAVGTLRDLLAFGRALLAPRFVAPETLDEATHVAFPGLDGVLPGFGRQTPCDWGLGFELKDGKPGHWAGTRTSSATFGHFGGSGTFLWVDPEIGVALACLDGSRVRRVGIDRLAGALGRGRRGVASLLGRDQRANELVERRLIAARDGRRQHRPERLAEERQAAHRVAGSHHRSARRAQHARDDDGEAAALVLGLEDHVTGTQLASFHPVGELPQGLARKPGQHLDPGELVHGRELMAHRSSVDRMASTVGMFEVQLAVSDLEAMTAFYRDGLGLEVSLHDPIRGRIHFRLGRGQLILALAEGEAEASPAWPGLPPPLLAAADRRGPTPPRHGPLHFAIEVPAGDVVPAGERLRAEHHDVRGPFRWPGGQLSVYLHDPEGNVVELISEPRT